jgi:hypothetical protein
VGWDLFIIHRDNSDMRPAATAKPKADSRGLSE